MSEVILQCLHPPTRLSDEFGSTEPLNSFHLALEGFTHLLKYQVMVEVYTCMGSDASLLAQQQDGRLMPEDTLHMAVRASWSPS